jgi:hypothetical protein
VHRHSFARAGHGDKLSGIQYKHMPQTIEDISQNVSHNLICIMDLFYSTENHRFNSGE